MNEKNPEKAEVAVNSSAKESRHEKHVIETTTATHPNPKLCKENLCFT